MNESLEQYNGYGELLGLEEVETMEGAGMGIDINVLEVGELEQD